MKTLQTLLLIFFCFTLPQAQETVGGKVLKNAKSKTYNKGEQKGDEAIDKTLDKVEEKIGNLFKKKKKKTTGENANTTTEKSQPAPGRKKSISSYSKFDFIPGEKILALEDFATTEVGDFPMGWNTNASAEIVLLDGSNDKWLSMTKDGYFQPDFVRDFPENFTLEFDVFTQYRSSNILEYQFFIAASDNPRRDLSEEHLSNYIQFKWLKCGNSNSFFVVEEGETINKNEGFSVPALVCEEANDEASVVRFSIWRQKNRLRVYANENKIMDIPQAFNPKLLYNVFKLGGKYMNYAQADKDDEFMVSNIRYAIGSPDTRNKLITEGKFVTTGILFDSNSAVIKPESYGVVKEIATVLKQNPNLNIKITGHTDSDGEVAFNLELSKKRALAVKELLQNEFAVDVSKIQTDGMGESEPVDPNDTAAGKSNNRRVVFTKI